MNKYLHPHSPWRIFAFSGLISSIAIVGVLIGQGVEAMLVTLVLIAVELAFSFDNAIVNTKILKQMSSFWQTMFLTVGAAVAIFGMRLVFPVVLVVLTSGLGWQEVVNLALKHPDLYAEKLKESHIQLSAFAGGFLLMLALHFFVDGSRKVLWLERLEAGMQRFAYSWAPALATFLIIASAAAMPFNRAPKETLVAGALGVIVYAAIHFLNTTLGRVQRQGAGAGRKLVLAGLVSFLYLQVLDASFSFDGVLGAFAVSDDVILIAVGLGIGAVWVRSLTVFMVRRGTLDNYKYIEHGAHYTIGVLAGVLILSIFADVPELIAGLLGVGIIGSSIVASRQALTAAKHASSR